MRKERELLVRLGDALNKRAKSKFNSNVELANVANVDEKTIRRLFQGEQNISINVLKRICDALDVKISDLMKEIGS